MVTLVGEPIVMDFGLARELEGDGPTLTQTGDLFGTPAYMSPEQLLAKRLRLDARTDVYSLGVTLFECLSLQRPFDAPTREGLYHAIQTKAPPELRRLNGAVSSDLAVVVATAMDKDRDRRYQTALAFAEDLRRVREHEPIVARPVGPLGRLVRWAQRNPAVASLTATVFFVLLAGLAPTTLLQTARADAPRNATAAAATSLRFATTSPSSSAWQTRGGWTICSGSRKRTSGPRCRRRYPAMMGWLDRARALLERLEGHEVALADLRVHAKPWTDEQRAKDRASHAAELELLAGLEDRIARAEAELKSVAASTRRESRKEELTEKLKSEIEQKRSHARHRARAARATAGFASG